MSSRNGYISDALYDYILSVSLRDLPVLAKLRQETAGLSNAGMQISPDQGQFMALLAKLTGAKKVLEVGVFTGYSSLVVALALPAEGRIVACDISEEYTRMARRYWQEAGVAHKIDLRLGPAADTLAGLVAAGEAGSFDFAFIDADKENYLVYYEHALQLLRPGGLVLVDNVLWGGRPIDPEAKDESTEAIRAINAKMGRDERVDVSMLPVGDGLTLARKR